MLISLHKLYMSMRVAFFLLILIGIGYSSPVHAACENVQGPCGIGASYSWYSNMTFWVTWCDYNNDGWPDTGTYFQGEMWGDQENELCYGGVTPVQQYTA